MINNRETRVVFNTLAQSGSRILIVIISLFTTSLLTRWLGSAGYGDYIFITSFILLFVSLTDLGLTTIGIRESSEKPDKARSVFGNIFTLRIILTTILTIFLFLLIKFLPQFNKLQLSGYIAILVLPFLMVRTASQGIFQTKLRMGISSLLEVLASILFLIFLIGFVILGKTTLLSTTMIFWVISAFVSGFVGYVISSKMIKLSPLFQKESLIRIFKEAIPLGLFLSVYAVYDRGIDSFLIKTYINSQAVGYYGLAYKIHGNLVLGAAFIMNSLFPVISSYKGNLELFNKIFQKTFSLLLFAGVLILIIGIIFAPWVVNVIGGADFIPSIGVLRILLFATLVSYINHLTGFSLVALGKQKNLFYYSLIGLIANLTLNIIFIPKFSIIAAAITTIATEAVLMVFTIYYLNKEFRIKFDIRKFPSDLKMLLAQKQKYFDTI